jgi:hypothetical protein
MKKITSLVAILVIIVFGLVAQQGFAKSSSKTEKEISEIYTKAKYFVGPITGNPLQGAASGLNCMGGAGVAQFYFFPSEEAAISAKARFDASAAAQHKDPTVGGWICRRDGNVIYMGHEKALEVYEKAK